MKQTEILTHATHVNGWEPAVYMSRMSQNFHLFHVSNLSVRNFRIFLLMYPGSAARERGGAGRVPNLATTRRHSNPTLRRTTVQTGGKKPLQSRPEEEVWERGMTGCWTFTGWSEVGVVQCPLSMVTPLRAAPPGRPPAAAAASRC